VTRFRGMFAFAIWDRREKRLMLARDRLGIKPVYYYWDKNRFVFASEIKALLEHADVPREMDGEALDLYLAARYLPGPRTIFKNIFKLQPGHLLTVSHLGVRIRKYWDIEYGEPMRHDDDLIERFGDLLQQSVELRLIAEVPLGVFLSGGLDSSAMVA